MRWTTDWLLEGLGVAALAICDTLHVLIFREKCVAYSGEQHHAHKHREHCVGWHDCGL